MHEVAWHKENTELYLYSCEMIFMNFNVVIVKETFRKVKTTQTSKNLQCLICKTACVQQVHWALQAEAKLVLTSNYVDLSLNLF